ncbi:GGDEF domain-containing protein [Nitrospina watsonii]|uniref:diguanylate cyclase n=1 Tax=Nitrospina watsonii TaxID=1323948 RepID=A0ABN8W2I9_9BACT|nr:GGDEF domain-containing protein [Nitrospina watsonii]CAI2719387.1 GGDEF domain-containing protein [Nitrospina watsonii]
MGIPSENTSLKLPGGGSITPEEVERLIALLTLFMDGAGRVLPADHGLHEKLDALKQQLPSVTVSVEPPLQKELQEGFDILKMNVDLRLLERGGLVEIIRALSRSLTSMFGKGSNLEQGLERLIDELEETRELKYTLAIRDKLLAITEQIQQRFGTVRNEFERLHEHCLTLQARVDTQGQVIVDGLTRILNRTAYDLKIDENLKVFHKTRDAFFLALFDIDDFLHIQDRQGAEAANNVLCSVAAVIRDGVRQSDFVYRYSQDQFVVLFHQSTYKNVRGAVERLRDQVETVRTHLMNDVHDQQGNRLRVTVSIGLAQAKEGDTKATLFKRAEGALHRAKLQGKNRVAIS